MQDFRFNASGKGQEGKVIEHELDPEELEMILDVVNWKDPDRYKDRIFEVHGRSIIFKSPTKDSDDTDNVWGRFDGLQLIGAGGNKFKLNGKGKGEYIDNIINPVNSKNHADYLSAILELREFDEQTGKLRFSSRPYAPMHGMDKGEAEKRSYYTSFLRNSIEKFYEKGRHPSVIVPKWVLNGVFPELKDDNGDNLRFHVYRVPTKKRTSGQVMQSFLDEGFDMLQNHLSKVSDAFGAVSRGFHESGLAYMDSHVDNMSFLEDKKNYALYTTDLGSMETVEDHPFKDKYFSFDIYMYLSSIKSMLEMVFDPIKNNIKGSDSIIEQNLHSSTMFFLNHYFRPEKENGLKDRLSPDYIYKNSGAFKDIVMADDYEVFFEAFSFFRKHIIDYSK
jgi:hypothetical protein